MVRIRIANLNIQINNRYSFLEKQCMNYLYDKDDIDFVVEVSDEEIEAERKNSDYDYPNGYLESICAYRAIANKIPAYNAFLLHAAIISYDNQGYGFLARSGTGKSTHIKLWKEYLKDVIYINGDKPLIRIIDGIPYAFGTPWNGKENYGTNASVPLKAIGFINRSENNYVKEMQNQEILSKLIYQILIPPAEYEASKTFELLNEMLKYTKVYNVYCNMDIEAARIAFNTMSK